MIFQHQNYINKVNVIMANNTCTSFTYEQDLQEIPSEFEQSRPSPNQQYNSNKFHSNITLTKPHQYDLLLPKKSQASSYLLKTQQYIVNKLQKISHLKTEQEHRVMNDCTFKPQINRSRSKSPRNIKQFLDSQQKHLQKIQEKKQILKERIQFENRKNMTFSPRINSSKSYRNKENVHERLYKLKDKQQKQPNYHQIYDHMPKITEKGERIVRNIPVDQLLYLDAMRRVEKQHQIPIPEIQEKNLQKNYIQQKYAAQKFLKDYKNALFATNLQQKTQYSQQQFLCLLRQLGYARYSVCHNTPLSMQQRKLLKDCYAYLQQYGITQINIYVFLLALGGIYNMDLNNQQISGVMIIEEEEGRKLHQYFDLLFRNRLFMDVSKKQQKTIYKQQNTFKPTINPDSQAMAEKYRHKMIQKANDIFTKNNIDIRLPQKGLSHEDLLVICSLGQNLQKQKMRQMRKQQKDPQCTFQPNSQKYPQQFISSQIGQQKCKQLYEHAKFKHDQIQKLATFRSYHNTSHDSKSRKKEGVSPRPNNNKNSSSICKSNIKSYLQIKDVDKTLARMVSGRKQRNEKRQFEERGEKTRKQSTKINHKISQNHSSFPPRQLLLDADIMVNNTKKKIFIYKDDQNRIEQVVQAFAKQCDLDQYSKKMLYERLTEAIKCVEQEQLQSDY